MALQQF